MTLAAGIVAAKIKSGDIPLLGMRGDAPKTTPPSLAGVLAGYAVAKIIVAAVAAVAALIFAVAVLIMAFKITP